MFKITIFTLQVKHFRKSFAFDAPKIWNDLPDYVRNVTYIAFFRKKLKTYLFESASTLGSLPHLCFLWLC